MDSKRNKLETLLDIIISQEWTDYISDEEKEYLEKLNKFKTIDRDTYELYSNKYLNINSCRELSQQANLYIKVLAAPKHL